MRFASDPAIGTWTGALVVSIAGVADHVLSDGAGLRVWQAKKEGRARSVPAFHTIRKKSPASEMLQNSIFYPAARG